MKQLNYIRLKKYKKWKLNFEFIIKSRKNNKSSNQSKILHTNYYNFNR